MADQIKNVTVNEATEETQAAEVKTEQQIAAPETNVQSQPSEQVKEKKEHPKWDAFKAGAKKAGKWIGLGAAVVGGLFVANKLGKAQGQAEGFDAACDAFAKSNPNQVPQLTIKDDPIGDDVEIEAEFVDLTNLDDPVIDTPAE